jgi:hypothetical protein
MVLQLMKIEIRTRLHRFPFKKYEDQYKELEKLVLKKKIAFARIIALEDTI